MSNFVLADASKKQAWSEEVTRENVRASGFAPYMSSKGGIIQVKNELKGSAGNVIHVPALAKLRGGVVRGSTTLVGAEQAQANYSMRITTDVVRTATVIPYTEAFKTEMDLYNEGKRAVTNQLAEATRDDIITALRSVPVTGTNGEDSAVTYETASAPNFLAWRAANADRILYGALNANYTTTHALALATINTDSTTLLNNKLTGKIVQLARKKARGTTNSSTFAITPYKTSNGSEWFVLFVDSNGYRDLKNDPAVYSANKDARPRETDIVENPIFSGTNVMFYDGVIIVEIPELGNGRVDTNGVTINNGTSVGYAQLCGVQAVNFGYSAMVRPVRRKEDDYEMLAGIGAMEVRGQAKASVALTQIGMVSVFHSSVDDA